MSAVELTKEATATVTVHQVPGGKEVFPHKTGSTVGDYVNDVRPTESLTVNGSPVSSDSIVEPGAVIVRAGNASNG